MVKLSSWFKKSKIKKALTDNFLAIGIGFLLLFIPLYPKLPLIDIAQTWVYIRLEDFLVAFLVGFWLVKVFLKKISLKIPVFIPIILYWFVGGLSLAYAILIARSPDFYPHLGILHFIRRIEYMVLFFIAFSTIRDLKIVKKYLFVLGLAVFLVCLYGFGQKFLSWPAFLTMNEEFAKGIPLYLPIEARTTSTFAGHYDLSAWLVLMIAIFSSCFFGFKKKIGKGISFFLVILSFLLLLFTASRVSFVCYLISISLMLFLQKKKLLIIPVVLLSLFLNYQSRSSERFIKTFRIQEVVYDVKTGKPIGVLEDPEDVGKVFTPEEEVAEDELPTGSGFLEVPIIQKTPPKKAEVVAIKRPVAKTLKTAELSSEIATVSGEFLIKRTIVYDVSFTTRFQGTWRRATEAFLENPFLGTGYSSIGLATDNSFLRALGETGILGFSTFLLIFFSLALLAKQGLEKISASFPRSFLIGVISGAAGIILNATLIDVFEASKVAFTFWIILGIAAGVVNFLVPQRKSLIKEAIKVFKWPQTAILFLFSVTILVFYPSLKNYFTADDFTWLRWAATSKISDIPSFFISAKGFFYRPLAKAYFTLVYPFLGLKPQGYHLFSLFLHFACSAGAYLLTLLLTKRKLVAFLTGLFFLICPVNSETVFWISSTSSLLASFFYIWGFLSYLKWREGKSLKSFFLLSSYFAFGLGLASHEKAITFPLAILFYDLVFEKLKNKKRRVLNIFSYFPFCFLTIFYFYLRSTAQAHGLSGDYNYNFKNLLFNFAGNTFGYLGELIFGSYFISIYDISRSFLRLHKEVAFLILLLVFALFYFLVYQRIRKSKIFIFSLGFFFILLLPFLGLGNIAERYLYPAQLGFFIFFSFLIVRLFDQIKKKNLLLGTVFFLVVVSASFGFYYKQLEEARRNWYYAGETSNDILLALGTNYKKFPPESTLYFVDLPIRQHRAWIFPVGLEDGVWFIYKNESLNIKKLTNRKKAFELKKEKPASFVFIFEQGKLKEIKFEKVE